MLKSFSKIASNRILIPSWTILSLGEGMVNGLNFPLLFGMYVLLEGLNLKDPFLKELQVSSNHFILIPSRVSLSKLLVILPGLDFIFE